MDKYFVTVDQVSINFPVNAMGGTNTALVISKELHLPEIFGESEKATALNFYNSAISYYQGQVKLMWNDRRRSQGLLLYLSATGFRALQHLSKMRGFDLDLYELIKFMQKKKARFTRLDVAIDVIDGNQTVDALHKKIQKKEIVFLDSMKRQIPFEHQKFYGANKKITGITCGARSSDNFLRLYDKKIEQSRADAPYLDLARQCNNWIRIEGEFKHSAAHAVIKDLADKDKELLNAKLIGYVVKRWIIADTEHNAIPLWQDLIEKADGAGTIPPLPPKLTDRFVQEIKWFLAGGAAGVFYRIEQLFGKEGEENFIRFLFNYVNKPNQKDHFAVPKNMGSDLKLIRTQHPNLGKIKDYLKQAVKEIENEKKSNQPDQSTD